MCRLIPPLFPGGLTLSLSGSKWFTEVVGKDLKEEEHSESHECHAWNQFPFQSKHRRDKTEASTHHSGVKGPKPDTL